MHSYQATSGFRPELSAYAPITMLGADRKRP